MPARQKRRAVGGGRTGSGAGMGVDTFGGPVIDPTENVLGIIDAESRHRDALRAADNKLHDAERLWHEKFQTSMRQAETQRINDLSMVKVRYTSIIEKMRSTFTESNAQSLSVQFKEFKNDLSERIAKLEQFRWESGGTRTGRGEVFAWLFMGIAGGAGLAAVIALFISRSS